MDALITELEALVERVVDLKVAQILESRSQTTVGAREAAALEERLALINAKQFISIGEAAQLLPWSDGHIRNLIKKARKKQAHIPIPFMDLDGVTAFDRLALLDWAKLHKQKLRRVPNEK